MSASRAPGEETFLPAPPGSLRKSSEFLKRYGSVGRQTIHATHLQSHLIVWRSRAPLAYYRRLSDDVRAGIGKTAAQEHRDCDCALCGGQHASPILLLSHTAVSLCSARHQACCCLRSPCGCYAESCACCSLHGAT